VPLVELGMDSLVAVEVRTWLLREFQVDWPVLKILSGSSIADIISCVEENLTERFLSKSSPIQVAETKASNTGDTEAPRLQTDDYTGIVPEVKTQSPTDHSYLAEWVEISATEPVAKNSNEIPTKSLETEAVTSKEEGQK
jgi:Phosphopantetheine attachment site